MAAQYGLDTPEGDVATVKRTLGRVSSPAILVGHSYGGSVITSAGTDDRVAGLVYIAALAPDADETSQSQQEKFPVTDVFKSSKSQTGASRCVHKASCASRETSRSKSKRLSGRPTMLRLPTSSAGMHRAPPGSRSRVGTSSPTTTARFSRICSGSWQSEWVQQRTLSTAATSRCCPTLAWSLTLSMAPQKPFRDHTLLREARHGRRSPLRFRRH